MAKKYYLAMAVGAAAVMLMSAGPLAAHNCAEPQMQSRAEPTEYADKNRDGKVTREEAKVDPALTRSFDRYDINDDNALDQAEFARLEAAATGGVAEDNPTVAVAPMEPIEYPGVDEDTRLRPRHVVHQDTAH